MYGIDERLDLSRFHGAVLTQICIGEFQLQFNFTRPELRLSIEGDWQLLTAGGEIIDQAAPNSDRDSYRVHHLLGRSVVGHELAAPKSFTLRFEDGSALVVFDSSESYESFSIQPGDIFV